MTIINWQIAGNPLNWAIILLIAVLWLAVIAVIFPPSSATSPIPPL